MLESQLPKLVRLLLTAGRRDLALALFANERWLKLRVEEFGFDHLIEDARLALTASVKDGRDDDVVRLLLRVDHAARTLRPAWDDGGAAIAIAAADSPRRIRGLLRSLGSLGNPWAAFLAVLRLLNLGAVAAANELLRNTSEEHWPGYQPRASADGLPSWADFGADPIVYFLARVMAASPELATRIVFRLYENQRPTVVPSVWSVWAALLEQLVATDAPVAHIIAAVEQVPDSILPRSTGLADVLIRLCEARQHAIEAVTDRTDMSWLLREIQISAHIFGYASKGVRDDQNRRCSLLASLLIHLVKVSELTRSQEFLKAIDQTVMMIKDSCGVPSIPERHEFGDRSEILARYAFALEGIRHVESLQAAKTALVAADLDAHSNDPPLAHVARALDWLEKLQMGDTAEQAVRLRRELKLSSPPREEAVWRPSVDTPDPFEYGLALLDGQPPKAVAPTRKRNRRGQLSQENSPPETVADRIRRALIGAWAGTTTPEAVQEAKRLDAARSEVSRAEFDIDLGVLRITVAQHATRSGEVGEAAIMLDTCIAEALQSGDISTAASAIANLALFDPEKAEKLLIDGQDRHPKAAGALAASVVVALTREEAFSTANRFASHLPAGQGRPKGYELWLISECNRHPQLAQHTEPLIDRCVDQLELDVAELGRQDRAEWSQKSAENNKLAPRIAAAAVTLGACGTVNPDVEDRLASVLGGLLSQIRAVDDRHTVANDFLKALVERQIDVRQRAAAEFLIDLAGTPVVDSFFPATLSGLDGFLHLASALADDNPREAHEIAAKAFAVARKAVTSTPTSGDTVQRAGVLLLETLASTVSGGGTFAARGAEDFVAAAEGWARKDGNSKVAHSLDELAEAALDETVKAILRAGAARLHLRARELLSAEHNLMSLPSSTLRSLEVLAELPAGDDQVVWSRKILGNRIAALLPGPDFDVGWLRKLFALGSSPLCPTDVVSRLRAIEAALLTEESSL